MEYISKTIELEKCTVTIRRPILSKEEQKKAEREVVQALERFGKAIEKEKRQ